MSTVSDTPTATSIATPNTERETYIGWDLSDPRNQPTDGWNWKRAGKFWKADFLYLKLTNYYQHLDQIDAGLKNGPTWWNQAYFTQWSNRDLITNLSSQLELLPRQQERAIRYFLGEDLRTWGIQKELVAWAICAYLVHSDERDKRKAHPLSTSENRIEQFWDVAYSLDFTRAERVSTYHKVQSKMESERGG